MMERGDRSDGQINVSQKRTVLAGVATVGLAYGVLAIGEHCGTERNKEAPVEAANVENPKDCEAVKKAAQLRIDQLLNTYICDAYVVNNEIVYAPRKRENAAWGGRDIDLRDDLKWQSAKPIGDCSAEIADYEDRIRKTKAGCDEFMEVVNVYQAPSAEAENTESDFQGQKERLSIHPNGLSHHIAF